MDRFMSSLLNLIQLKLQLNFRVVSVHYLQIPNTKKPEQCLQGSDTLVGNLGPNLQNILRFDLRLL